MKTDEWLRSPFGNLRRATPMLVWGRREWRSLVSWNSIRIHCSAMRAEMQAGEKNPRKNGKEIQKTVNEKARSNVYISENKWKEVRRWMRARFRRKR